jgi:hypothetical protein
MGSGGNGQAQESANLQTSQNNQSERYGAASDIFDSEQYLSVFKGNPSYQANSNASLSRSFGSTVSSTSDSTPSFQEQYEKLMSADRQRQDRLRATNQQQYLKAGAISERTNEA